MCREWWPKSVSSECECKTNINSIRQSRKALSLISSQGKGVGFSGAGFGGRLRK